MTTTKDKKYMASSTVHKKYKHYSTYNPKIITIDGSKITSEIIDESFDSQDDAKAKAEQMIQERHS